MKMTVISMLIAVVLIVGAMVMAGGRNGQSDNTQTVNNVSIIDGKQIIEIDAKGGYSPRVTNAKAGLPTIIKVNTKATFDCSSALTIPSLGYSNHLPSSGNTLIDVPPQKAGAIVQGFCSMGMYNFQVKFD